MQIYYHILAFSIPIKELSNGKRLCVCCARSRTSTYRIQILVKIPTCGGPNFPSYDASKAVISMNRFILKGAEKNWNNHMSNILTLQRLGRGYYTRGGTWKISENILQEICGNFPNFKFPIWEISHLGNLI